MSLIPATAVPFTGEDFTLDQSLRFDDPAIDEDVYLTRSWTSTNTVATHSLWFKKSQMATNGQRFTTNSAGYYDTFKGDDTLFGYGATGGDEWRTVAKYRDPSAWYHYVKVVDSQYSAAADRVKVYINGVQQTLTFSGTGGQNNSEGFSSAGSQKIGTGFNGCLAEYHYIEGTAYAPTSFGETGDYGEWKPIEVEGLTYGTNGFYLNFADSAALGDDVSGESNDFAVTNLTAADQMLDTPTNNFPTWNPLNVATAGTGTIALSEGNLKNSLHNDSGAKATMLIPETGKWYWEVNMADVGLNTASGIADDTGVSVGNGSMATNGRFGYFRSGNAVGDGSYATFGDSFTDGDILSVAFDVDNEALYFAKNGTWQNSGDPTSGASKTGAAFTTTLGSYGNYVPVGYGAGGDSIFIANFGQDSSFAGEETAQGNQDANEIGDFYYTVPADYLALCTSNLPDVDVIPSEHFNTITYTGNNGASAITGVGFQPDFVWFKARNLTEGHMLFDAVRGAAKTLFSNHTGAENTSYTNVLSAFNADGYTLGSNEGVNHSSGNYVAWNWKANGSGSSGSSGTGGLTPTVSANVDAGFSIVGWIGNMGLDTFTHGLSKAPEMMILKNRDNAGTNWCVWHKDLPTNKMMRMESTVHPVDGFAQFGDDTNIVVPTSTYFTVGNSNTTNANSKKIVNYLFHSVEGYSKIGSYIGNGNADGPFIYLGFRPAWIMYTTIDGTANHWVIRDNKRDPHNEALVSLYANLSNADDTGGDAIAIDMVSNGFKIRRTNSQVNENGTTYIYIAFAETPFKYANAR